MPIRKSHQETPSPSTITITDVDEAPVFDDRDDTTQGVQAPPTVLRVAENETEIDADLTEAATGVQLPTYTATDPEERNG